ncbi:MAG: hypothetical protein M1514_02315, partial [Patescibacteria group bacterium]|nr:hypothetical protein [Patescibacteria group bacterium]
KLVSYPDSQGGGFSYPASHYTSHEVCHACQFALYPRMPLAQKEFEAYLIDQKHTIYPGEKQPTFYPENIIQSMEYSLYYGLKPDGDIIRFGGKQ